MTADERKQIEYRLRRASEMYDMTIRFIEDEFEKLTPDELAELRSHYRTLDTVMVRIDRLLREAEMAG